MNELHPNLPSLPDRIKSLPVDDRGYPVPWFIQWFMPDGTPTEPAVATAKPDFRVIDSRKFRRAVMERRCWVCGEELGKFYAFVIGPMCAINRVSSEPPSHRECAEFSARACPFLTKPKVVRREEGTPEGVVDAAGFGLKRNPGVALVWITRSFTMFPVAAERGASAGHLFEVGEPLETLWFAEGRIAKRDEIMHSIETGLPLLHEAALVDGKPALDELSRRYQQALTLLPAA